MKWDILKPLLHIAIKRSTSQLAIFASHLLNAKQSPKLLKLKQCTNIYTLSIDTNPSRHRRGSLRSGNAAVWGGLSAMCNKVLLDVWAKEGHFAWRCWWWLQVGGKYFHVRKSVPSKTWGSGIWQHWQNEHKSRTIGNDAITFWIWIQLHVAQNTK